MANFKIEIGRSAEKALFALPKKDIIRIVSVIQGLATDPYPQGCRKLHGEGETYRIRSGVYRVIYEVYPKLILVKILKIGHRKDIYR